MNLIKNKSDGDGGVVGWGESLATRELGFWYLANPGISL